ncbi:MAG: hypothetical protein ABIL39_11195 [candidate division WOR-3 bacterium]
MFKKRVRELKGRPAKKPAPMTYLKTYPRFHKLTWAIRFNIFLSNRFVFRNTKEEKRVTREKKEGGSTV